MRNIYILILFSVCIVLATSCNLNQEEGLKSPSFIGNQSCIECHEDEYHAWLGSDHDMAMDTAIDETVLGDFNDAEFIRDGFVNRMYKKDGKFFVHTRGPDGIPGDFQIAYTFGYKPLQQYLIPFEKGRYQCLQITWDTDKNRWYHLSDSVYQGEIIKPDDWLYWTNNGQNWNGMCAECHSTNLQKNYNPETHVFNTTWSEIDVSCEACHGPASEHINWSERSDQDKLQINNFGLPVKTSKISSQQLVGQCAYCHARRSSFDDFEHPRNNEFEILSPQLPVPPYYHIDGQILEEDYVYASFTQSSMYMNKVGCNDCHDVHSLKVKFDGDNRLCLQCHVKTDYDNYKHHHHRYAHEKGNPILLSGGVEIIEVGEGVKCINCHMPGDYYMGVDFRRDHSMRIPRPDLSISLGTPNACNSQCHKDKTPEWAASFTKKWYGVKDSLHFGEVFFKAINNDSTSIGDLKSIIANESNPPIIRAAAVSYFVRFPSNETNTLIRELLHDSHPLIRDEAAKSFMANNMDDLIQTISPLLRDSAQNVRLSAAIALSVVPSELFDSITKSTLNSGIKTYIEVMNYAADFAASRHNLGNLYSNMNNNNEAINNYKEAIRIDDLFYPSKINLAMLYNSMGDNDKAEILLKDVIKKHPELPDTYYSLGLLMAEKGNYLESEKFLKEAAERLPERSRVFYNLALIQQYLNNLKEAEIAFIKAYELSPENLDYLVAVIDFYLKSNDNLKAEKYVNEMLKQYPEDKSGYELLELIKQKKGVDSNIN